MLFPFFCFASRSQRADGARRAARLNAARVESRLRNQFGAPRTAAAKWSAPTLFVPGHSLDASSWSSAVKYGSKGGNGEYAAVYSGKTKKWHRNNAKGVVLSDDEVRRTNMHIVDFANRFGARRDKARQIAEASAEMRRLRGSVGPLEVNVVTHSAGDIDFDTAAANGSLDQSLRVRNRIAIGPVFDGTYVGSVGGQVLSRMGSVGRILGAQAAREVAENSDDIRQVQAQQAAMQQGFYKGTRRVDIQTNGAIGLTPRLSDRSLGAGDGFVQSSQRRPFVAETRVVDGFDPTAFNHLKQPGFGGVLTEINDILQH